MSDQQPVAVGDEVMVSRSGGRFGYVPGVVTAVKRVWLTVQAKGQGEYRFRIDTHKDDNPDFPAGFWTMQEYEEIALNKAASGFLLDEGIYLNSSSRWYDRKVELAKLLGFTPKGDS